MRADEIKLHQEHCCKRHKSCFLNDPNCPVLKSEVASTYDCPECKAEGLPSAEEQAALEAADPTVDINRYIEKLIMDFQVALSKKKNFHALLLQGAILDARIQRLEQFIFRKRM
jgi:hypothetical protein